MTNLNNIIVVAVLIGLAILAVAAQPQPAAGPVIKSVVIGDLYPGSGPWLAYRMGSSVHYVKMAAITGAIESITGEERTTLYMGAAKLYNHITAPGELAAELEEYWEADVPPSILDLLPELEN